MNTNGKRVGAVFLVSAYAKSGLLRRCSQSPWSLNNACDIRAAERNTHRRVRVCACAGFGESAGGTARLLG